MDIIDLSKKHKPQVLIMVRESIHKFKRKGNCSLIDSALKYTSFEGRKRYKSCVSLSLDILGELVPGLLNWSNGCSSLLYKMAQYLHITYSYPPIYFKLTLDYVYYLTRCKWYVNSCKHNAIVMWVVAGAGQVQICSLELSETFLSKYFPGWFVVYEDAEPGYTESLLYFFSLHVVSFLCVCGNRWIVSQKCYSAIILRHFKAVLFFSIGFSFLFPYSPHGYSPSVKLGCY